MARAYAAGKGAELAARLVEMQGSAPARHPSFPVEGGAHVGATPDGEVVLCAAATPKRALEVLSLAARLQSLKFRFVQIVRRACASSSLNFCALAAGPWARGARGGCLPTRRLQTGGATSAPAFG